LAMGPPKGRMLPTHAQLPPTAHITANDAGGKAEENNTIEIRCPKKTGRRKTSTFRLTDLHGNQLAADSERIFAFWTSRN